MPPKPKNKAKLATAKQKKAIQSRLMCISLKVDRYVYKNRPILVSEAAALVAEIAGYEVQCSGNARFLQVIEKLLRCLRSIISEQEQGCGDPNSPQSPRYEYRCESPVYSLPDEDRVAITQHALATAEHDKVTNALNETGADTHWLDDCLMAKTATSVTHSDIQNKEANNYLIANPKDNNVTEIIDLCDDDDDGLEKYSQQSVDVDIDMYRALSNLSLKETETVNVDIECSQSILQDFNNNNANIPSNDNAHVQTVKGNSEFKKPQIQANIIKPIGKIQQQEIPAIQNNKDSSKSNESNTEISKLSEENNIYQIVESDKNPMEMALNKKVQRNQSNKVKPEKKNNAVKGKKKRAKKPINDTVTKVQSEGVHSNSKTAPTEITHDSYSAPVNKENTPSNLLSKPDSKPLVNNRTNDEISKVYNKCVVEDLSWIENIRFVRETEREEFDPNLSSVEDTFWHNCMLPPMFDEHDFKLY